MNTRLKTLILIIFSIFITILIGYKIYNYIDPINQVYEVFEPIINRDLYKFNQKVDKDRLIKNSLQLYKDSLKKDEDDDLFKIIEKYIDKTINLFYEDIEKLESEIFINQYFNVENNDPSFYPLINKEYYPILESFDLNSIKLISYKKINNTELYNIKILNNYLNKTFEFKMVFENKKLVSINNINDLIHDFKIELNSIKDKRIKENSLFYQSNYLFIKEYFTYKKNHWSDELPFINLIPIFMTTHGFLVENVSNKKIKSFQLKMTFRDNFKNILFETKETIDKNIEPNSFFRFKINSFNPFVYDQIALNNIPEISIVSIYFSNGDKIVNEENAPYRFSEQISN